MGTRTLQGLVNLADAARLSLRSMLHDTRTQFGQFMTPAPVASFMAGLLRTRRRQLRILDPGAGVGTLTAAVVDQLLAREIPPDEIAAVCFEVDSRLFAKLEKTVAVCRDRCRSRGVRFSFDIRRCD